MLELQDLIFIKNLIQVTAKRNAYTKKEFKHVDLLYQKINNILKPYLLISRAAAAIVVVNAFKTSVKITNSAKDIQRISRGFLARKNQKLKLKI